MTPARRPLRFSMPCTSLALGLILAIAPRPSDRAGAAPPAAASIAPSLLGQTERGTIRGRLVWGGEEAPAPKVLVPIGKASINPEICAKDAPILDQALLVDPKTRGVANGVAYLVFPPGAVKEPFAQHPTVVLDQRNGEFRPYALPMHQDQTLVIKSSDSTISHHVRMRPFTNNPMNQTLGPGARLEVRLVAESQPIVLTSDIHPWMSAWLLVFDHPYFSKTGADGSFEMKGVPAGRQQLVVLHTSGYVTSGRSRGMSVEVKAGEAVDVGELKLDPKQVGIVEKPPQQPLRVGEIAPPVVATLASGDWDIERYYRGRYVLLTFWSLNDADSRRQFEELKRLRREIIEDDRLLILSICTDENWDAWMRFLESQGKADYGDRDRPGTIIFYMDHKWLNAMQDDSNFNSADAYGAKRLPEAYLIGPDKRLRSMRIPVDKLREVVRTALHEKH